MNGREIISTDEAPEAIGPYSQAISAQGLVFTSGQIALDPVTGDLSDGGVAQQTDIVLRNLVAVLAAAGCAPTDVLRTTVYLVSMDDFPIVNEVYGRVFGSHPPARACVEVSRLPKGALVEIDAVALRS